MRLIIYEILIRIVVWICDRLCGTDLIGLSVPYTGELTVCVPAHDH